MKNVLVLTSGGIDSTTLLYYHAKRKQLAGAIAFNYGQRHLKELEFAGLNAQALGVPITTVNISSLGPILSGSSQTDASVPVPEGHYSEESMKATVVPNRNMILLSIAIGAAIAKKIDFVAYAAHAGDHAIYPDCRPEFTKAMGSAARLCDWRKITLLRPFIKMTKGWIVAEGEELGVDFTKTWSCYQGGALHCGRCGTCVERRLAFIEAKVVDPTTYQDPDFALQYQK